MKHKVFLLFICFSLALSACGGRLPKPARAKSVMSHYFKQYGKKYKKSEFAHHTVREVEILDTEEIHKNLVQITAFVTLDDNNVFKVRFTMEKKSLGWRAVSWENLIGQTAATPENAPQ